MASGQDCANRAATHHYSSHRDSHYALADIAGKWLMLTISVARQ